MKRLFTLLLIVGAQALSAQHHGATIEKRERYIHTHPEYRLKQQKMEQEVQQYLSKKSFLKTSGVDGVITIPVVFHVVYKTTAQNLPDAQLFSQLEVLNDDFRRLNADTVNTPSEYLGVAADTKIEFCLASRDPLGNSTSGIERKQTNKTQFDYLEDDVMFDETGGLDAWNRDAYLNIWVCNLGDNLLGYAQFPGLPAETDGVVIHYEFLGSGGTAQAPYNLGRTCTHEVGHWLGLEHPWGEGGCNVDDDIADTPTCSGDYESEVDKGCPSPGDECGDGRRMIENYMDYSQDACFNIFTRGQADRISAVINTQRQSLLSSTGCRAFDAKPLVNFTADKNIVYQGGEVKFKEFVEDEESFTWTFEGANIATSVDANPLVTYLDIGTHDVTITAQNQIGDSSLTKKEFIEVLETTESTTFEHFFVGNPVLEETTQGYVSGHNSFEDKAKANYYESPKPYVAIEGIKYVFGHVQYDDPDAVIEVVLWEEENGMPGDELYSEQVKLSELVVDDTLTIRFDSPVEMLKPYFAGIKLNYKPSEIEENSVALYMTREGEVTPGIAWEQLFNSQWVPFTEPDFSWGKNVALSIYPMLKILPPELSFEAERTTFPAGEEIVINNTTKYAYDHDWVLDEALIDGFEANFSPIVSYENQGTYSVLLQASNFLYTDELYKEDYLTVEEAVTNSIDDIYTLSAKVFPNPFTSNVEIQSDDIIKEVVGYDLSGRKLFRETIEAKQVSLNLEYLKEQVFILEIIGFKQKNRILLYKH